MSIITTGGIEVPAPKCGPTRFGLLSVAEVVDREDGHWEAGLWHTQLPCDGIQTMVVNCVPDFDDHVTKESSGDMSYPQSDPWVAIAPYECSVLGRPLSEAFDLAAARLAQGESRAVERTFWDGKDSLGNPLRQTLGAGDPDVVDLTPGTGAVSVTDGLALLEEYAGGITACAPILHANKAVGTYLSERNLIGYSGSSLYARATQTRVALGGGYLTTGPNGIPAPAGEAWMFITGAVKITRGPVFFTPTQSDVAEAVDRQINDVQVFAERIYAFSRGCGIAAVRVTRAGCC